MIQEFIEFMKNVISDDNVEYKEQDGVMVPYSPFNLTESDLNTMVIRSLNYLNIKQYDIDTVVYPGSEKHNLNLVSMIVGCLSNYLKDCGQVSYVELKKLSADQVQVDRKQFVQDLMRREPALQGMSVDTIYKLSQDLENLGDTLFSMRSHIHPNALRKYIKNIKSYLLFVQNTR